MGYQRNYSKYIGKDVPIGYKSLIRHKSNQKGTDAIYSQTRIPRLNRQRLMLSSNVKYLGIILDPKLIWGLNMELRVKGACIAFHAYNNLHKEMGTPAEDSCLNVHEL